MIVLGGSYLPGEHPAGPFFFGVFLHIETARFYSSSSFLGCNKRQDITHVSWKERDTFLYCSVKCGNGSLNQDMNADKNKKKEKRLKKNFSKERLMRAGAPYITRNPRLGKNNAALFIIESPLPCIVLRKWCYGHARKNYTKKAWWENVAGRRSPQPQSRPALCAETLPVMTIAAFNLFDWSISSSKRMLSSSLDLILALFCFVLNFTKKRGGHGLKKGNRTNRDRLA